MNRTPFSLRESDNAEFHPWVLPIIYPGDKVGRAVAGTFGLYMLLAPYDGEINDFHLIHLRKCQGKIHFPGQRCIALRDSGANPPILGRRPGLISLLSTP